MGSSLVSVVIPTFNREKEVIDTINSVIQQTYTNLEIIIVDDASTDNTVALVKELIDDRIKIHVLDENSKGTKPRNTGINMASGKYIALLDSDDEWIPKKIEKQIELAQSIHEDDFLIFNDVYIRKDGKDSHFINKIFKKETNIMNYILQDLNVVQTSSYFFPAQLGKKVLFNSKLRKHQDWDFVKRLRDKGAVFYHLPEPLTIYNQDVDASKITSSHNSEISANWLSSIRDDISKEAYSVFRFYALVNPYVLERRRYKALKICINAFKYKKIPRISIVRNLIKCFLPSFILKKIIV